MRILSRKILIIIIAVIIALSLNFFQKEVKGFFYFVSSPIQKTLWKTGDSVSDFFESITDLKNIKLENEDLKLMVQQLLAENAFLRELGRENKLLREALEIDLQKEFRLALVEVTSKDANQDAIVINQGSKHGISEGMPIITQQKTLLGKVSEVYDGFSLVMLISNKNSSFDAKVPDSGIAGVVRGGGSLKLHLDLVPKDEELNEGDLIISSALGGIYPEGVLAGSVKSVKQSDVKPFYEADVIPFFDIKELESVFIILNF